MTICKYSLLIALSIFCQNSCLAQWIKLQSFTSSYVKDLTIVNGNFYACSSNDGVFKSIDGGENWTQDNYGLINADSRRSFDIDYINGYLFLASVDGIYAKPVSVSSWEKRSNGITIGPGANNIFAFSIFENNGTLFSGVHNGIYYSTNFSENWQLTSISGQHTNVVTFTSFHGNMYAGRDAINSPAAYKSSNGGINWNVMNIWNVFPVSSFCFFADSDTLFTGTAHGMFYSTNDGSNWSMRNNGLAPDPYVTSIVKTGNVMIASLKFGGSGVFKSFNNGVNWIEIMDNLPFLNEINKITIHDNFIYISTSEGIWKRPVNQIVTGTVNGDFSVPDKFILHQNYPNPFNPGTKISFEIKSSAGGTGCVSVKIFDLTGKEIAVIFNERKNPGMYSVEFNGSNYPGGVYYYSMLIDGKIKDTRKMLLIK